MSAEFQGQSTLVTTVCDEPFVSGKDCRELRNGDGDFIFFETMGEVERHVGERLRPADAFPILLVLSDINWRELDDFYRQRVVDGRRDARYADDYERASFDHILASQNPETGMMCYYVPLRSGSHKVYNDPLNSFWCCTETASKTMRSTTTAFISTMTVTCS